MSLHPNQIHELILQSLSKYSFLIFIPSYRRAVLCREKTLSLLLNANVNRERIFVGIVMEEFQIYNEFIPRHMYNQFIIGPKGLVEQRDYMMSFVPNGGQILFIDDDICQLTIYSNCGENMNIFPAMIPEKKIEQTNKFINEGIENGLVDHHGNIYYQGKIFNKNQYIHQKEDTNGTKPLESKPTNKLDLSFDNFVDDAFFKCFMQGASIWGINQSQNHMHAKTNSVQIGLYYVCGGFYGIQKTDNIPMLEIALRNNGQKEDVERSLLHYLRDGKVVRFPNILIQTRNFNKGGMGTIKDRVNDAYNAVMQLKEKFPLFGVLFFRNDNHSRYPGLAEFNLKIVDVNHILFENCLKRYPSCFSRNAWILDPLVYSQNLETFHVMNNSFHLPPPRKPISENEAFTLSESSKVSDRNNVQKPFVCRNVFSNPDKFI